jgi:hypothetical protein
MGFAQLAKTGIDVRIGSTHPTNRRPFDFGYHSGNELMRPRAKARKVHRIQLESTSWETTGQPLSSRPL